MRINILNFRRTNPPLWLERNALFRKLYVLRQLYLVRHRKKLYSDTDIIIHRLVSELTDAAQLPTKGFYVDVGCLHPTKINTTYTLYRRGWSGINIDADSIKIAAFDIKRPRDINIACAISDRTGEMTFWRRGLWSGRSSLEDHSQLGWKPYKVTADTLTNILGRTRYTGQLIDFLSIDVEGHDTQVLKSLDFGLYKPKIVCIETWTNGLDQVMREEVYRFLTGMGYVLINWVDRNLLFLRSDCAAKWAPHTPQKD